MIQWVSGSNRGGGGGSREKNVSTAVHELNMYTDEITVISTHLHQFKEIILHVPYFTYHILHHQNYVHPFKHWLYTFFAQFVSEHYLPNWHTK
jgi:hypothetical protein